MYKLTYFTEEDEAKVIAFLKENSFALVTGNSHGYPVATQLPLNIKIENGKIFLTGHLMKNTDHHKSFLQNENVLVVFNGAHCYVSASWYTKQNVASTWNYMAVHAKGKLKFGDELQTKNAIQEITNKYENSQSNAAFNKLPVDYVDRLVKAIVAFTIEVESMENVFKLSQNHDEETRKSIIENLHNNGSDNEKAIASEMEKRIKMPKQ